MTKEIERTAVNPERQAELEFIFRPFYEIGEINLPSTFLPTVLAAPQDEK